MLTIRTADVDDAAAIARVQVNTWKTAYKGIIPRQYLNAMSEAEQTLAWTIVLQQDTAARCTALVSEDHDQTIVGFAAAGPLRHPDQRYQGEISSLYVQPSHQRESHGRRLFLAAANRLAALGLTGLFVWVLAENPARAFYEKLGGARVAETTRVLAGKKLKEVGYGWETTPSYGAGQMHTTSGQFRLVR